MGIRLISYSFSFLFHQLTGTVFYTCKLLYSLSLSWYPFIFSNSSIHRITFFQYDTSSQFIHYDNNLKTKTIPLPPHPNFTHNHNKNHRTNQYLNKNKLNKIQSINSGEKKRRHPESSLTREKKKHLCK